MFFCYQPTLVCLELAQLISHWSFWCAPQCDSYVHTCLKEETTAGFDSKGLNELLNYREKTFFLSHDWKELTSLAIEILC